MDAEDVEHQSAGVLLEDVNRLGSKYHKIELVNLRRERNARNGLVTQTNPL